jgi:hypothetical protein
LTRLTITAAGALAVADCAGHGAVDAAAPLALTSGAPDAWAVPAEAQPYAASLTDATCWSTNEMQTTATTTAANAATAPIVTCAVRLRRSLRRHEDDRRADISLHLLGLS